MKTNSCFFPGNTRNSYLIKGQGQVQSGGTSEKQRFILSTGSQGEYPVPPLKKFSSLECNQQKRYSIIVEDDDESKNSSSYDFNSPKNAIPTLGDRISNFKDTLPNLESNIEYSTHVVDLENGSGSNLSHTSMLSQVSSSSEEIPSNNFEKKEKMFCTKKHLFLLHSEIIKSNKIALKKLKKENKILQQCINKIVLEGKFRETLSEIRKMILDYSKVFSRVSCNIKDGEDLFSNINPKRSLFVLESNICNQMKIFRKNLDHDLVKKLQSLSTKIQAIVEPHHELVRTKMAELNKFGKNMYQEHWIISPFTKSIFKEKLEEINFFRIISPRYRRYMKKKLGLSRNSMVNNEDLVDFFQYFQMNYTADSAFCAGWILGSYSTADGSMTKCILALDVRI